MKKKVIILGGVILLIAVGVYPIMNKSNDKTTSNGELKVYIIKDDPIQSKLLDAYSSKYPDVKINKIEFADQEDYNTKLSADLLAGNGPDVIFSFSAGTKRLNKIIDSGVLKDLNELIDEDHEFSIDDYNKVVLDCGVYDDKRVFLPFEYSAPNYLAIKKVLEQNNVKLTGNENFHEVLQGFDSYFKNGWNDERLLFSVFPSIHEFISMNGLECIDYKNKKADFDNEKIKNIIEDYKKIYQSSLNSDIKEKYKYDDLEMMNDGKIIIENTNAIPSLLYKICQSSEKNNNDLVFLDSLSNNTATLGAYMAINNNSQNQKEAFNFIKLGISEEFQSENNITYDHNVPINNKAKNNRIENEEGGYSSKSEVIVNAGEKIKQRINNIDKCVMNDQIAENLMGEELLLYFNDKETLDNCINNMQEKVNLYLNE